MTIRGIDAIAGQEQIYQRRCTAAFLPLDKPLVNTCVKKWLGSGGSHHKKTSVKLNDTPESVWILPEDVCHQRGSSCAGEDEPTRKTRPFSCAAPKRLDNKTLTPRYWPELENGSKEDGFGARCNASVLVLISGAWAANRRILEEQK